MTGVSASKIQPADIHAASVTLKGYGLEGLRGLLIRILPSGKLALLGCWSGLGLLLHYYSLGVYGDFLEARNYFRCASFLISAPEMLAKKLF